MSAGGGLHNLSVARIFKNKIKHVMKSTNFIVSAIVTVMTSLLLFSCTETLYPEMQNDTDKISFEATTTRGTAVTSSSQVTSFGVSASIYPATASYKSYGSGSFFYNLPVEPGVNTSYYWPTTDYKVSFYAYYPLGDSNYHFASLAATTPGIPTYVVSVPSAIANQKDFMTAQVLDHACGPQGPVTMSMKHRTSAVCFNVTNNRSGAITLNSVSIEGVKYNGTIKNEEWTVTGGVNSSSTNPFTLAYNNTIAADATVDVTSTTNIFFMIPQSLPAGAKVKAVVDNEEFETNITGTWEQGKKYTYNIEVSNDNIVIVDETSDIDDWEDPYLSEYLTFTAIEDGTFTLTIPASVNTSYLTSVSYSVDNGATWVTTPNTSSEVVITTPTITAGNKVLWKGTGNTYGNPNNSNYNSIFSSTEDFEVSGNIMSLLYGDDFKNQKTIISSNAFVRLFSAAIGIINAKNLRLPATTITNYCYQNMFTGCRFLKTAPKILPATTLRQYCYANMFQNCYNLITAPELPATTLAVNCCQSMFANCSNLTTAPELPATTIAQYCYASMFSGCTSLTTAPDLPATTLANYCYQYMLNGCTSLTTAPELPATTLANYCYCYMFYGCTSLTTAPSELPATTLKSYCYNSMFLNCSSLTTAPEMPATTLADYCYASMFSGCTSLTTAPSELPATTMADYCYYGMFRNCTSLTTAPELPATTLANNCYYGMFSSCTSLTTAPSELPATTMADNCCQNMFAYCSSLTTAPELPATTMAKNCYYTMFTGCTSLTTAPELPATTLANNCYYGMFSSCTSLTTAPSELPATTMADYCYYGMFRNCTSLTTPPELSATTMRQYCCYEMFYGCTSLTTAPEIQATTLANYCCGSMFDMCSNLMTGPTILPATTLANNCYYNMFYTCTSLVNAPELPATTLVSNCYYQMFYYCTNLKYVKAAFTTTPSNSYTRDWLRGVGSGGTFYKNINATWTNTGTNAAPSNWTIVTYDPTL